MTHTRRYPRLPCFIAVELRSRDPDLFAVGNLSSIGQGGCGIDTETPIHTGALIEVACAESESVRILGQVVNCRALEDRPGFGIGIEFSDTEDRIAAFVSFMEGKGKLTGQAYSYLKYIRRKDEGPLS